MDPTNKRYDMDPSSQNYKSFSNVPCGSLDDFLSNIDSMARRLSEKEHLNIKAALHFFEVNEQYLNNRNIFKSDTAEKLMLLVQRVSSKIDEESPQYNTLQKVVNFTHSLRLNADDLLVGGEGAPLLQKILGYNTSKMDLGRAPQVSKKWKKPAEAVKVPYINSHPEEPLANLGVKTLPDLLEFVKKNGRKLHCLNLLGHKQLDGRLIEILTYCPNINSLALDCEFIKENELKGIVGLPLKSVRFENCATFTDMAVTYLKGMSLSSVIFSHCPGFCDHAVEYIKQENMPLTHIEFRECDGISVWSPKKFRHLPDLKMVFSGRMFRNPFGR